MDSIQRYYNPTVNLPALPSDTEAGIGQSGNVDVYGGHVFFPHLNHPQVSYYPTFIPEKKVRLHLEPDYNVIFQMSPYFCPQVGSSNTDVQLSID